MAQGEANDEARQKAVAADHYLHLGFMWGTALYAWQLHGLLVAALVLAALWTTTIATNAMLMTHWAITGDEAKGPWRRLRINRWGWVVVTYILLGLSAAESCDSPGHCSSLF